MVSARSSKEDIEKGFSLGASDYLTKPFEMDQMLTTINKALCESYI